MAKQRPSLGVSASPTSTFVAPIDPEKLVSPIDAQSIRNSYAFADAFSELSNTAAKFAATIKTEQNKEEFQKGQDLVNQNRKTYGELVRSGQILPSENPWLAVGAQEASGIIEASKARDEFKAKYEADVAENPALLDSTDYFDSLASSFVAKKNAEFGTSQYLSRSFYANFNPYIIDLQSKNSEAVGKRRIDKIVESVSSSVDMAIDDAMSVAERTSYDVPYPETGTIAQRKAWFAEFSKPSRNRDKYISQVVVPHLQASLDEAGKNSGFPELSNKAMVQSLIERMTTSDNPEVVEAILSGLRGGTGALKDTDFARQLLSSNESKIRANFERMTHEDSRYFTDLAKSLADKIYKGDISAEAAEEQFRAESSRKISANEVESKIPFMNGLVAKRRAEATALVKESADRTKSFQSAEVERSKVRTDEVLGSFAQTYIDTIRRGGTTSEQRAQKADEFRQLLLSNIQARDSNGNPMLIDQFDNNGILIGRVPATHYSIGSVSEKLDAFVTTIEKEANRTLDRSQQAVVDSTLYSVSEEIKKNGGYGEINFNSLLSVFNEKMNSAGISLDDGKVKTARKQLVLDAKKAFTDASKLAAESIGQQSLDFAPGEAANIRDAKARARGVLNLNKIMFAEAFDDPEYTTEFRNLSRTLLTYNLQGGIPQQVEDTVYLYESAKVQQIDMDTLFGNGTYGKKTKEFYERVSQFRASGVPMQEAVKRAQAGIQYTDIGPFGDVDLKGSESDKIGFTEKLAEVLNVYNTTHEGKYSWWSFDYRPVTPLNYEGITLIKQVFLDEYRNNLAETQNHRAALDAAEEAVSAKVIKTGGSAVLASDLNGIGASQFKILAVEASTEGRTKQERKDASFVMVGRTPQGESVFALRGKDGMSISDKAFKISEIKKMLEDGEMVKRLKIELEAERKRQIESAPNFTTGYGPM
jgi:hypothetical protein